VIIKFIFLQGNSASAIHSTLTSVLSKHSPSIRTIQRWVAAFRGGKFDVDDDERTGRPSTACTDANVTLVESKVKENRRITIRALMEETGLSHGTVERILTETLGLRRVVAKWIPHSLSEEQKNSRVMICRQHLRTYRKEGNSFLEKIVAGDETWCHSFELQSSE
jgi:histone-lysine N-methyltransferase SETMAR